jgi:hypothetical protein
MQWSSAGGLLGNSSDSGGAATYLSSSTVRAYLGVIDAAAGGTFNGTLNVRDVYPNTNNTYALGSNILRFSSIHGTNIYDSGNRVVTSVVPTGVNAIGIGGLVSNGTQTRIKHRQLNLLEL